MIHNTTDIEIPLYKWIQGIDTISVMIIFFNQLQFYPHIHRTTCS
jgi:hypothetical protein